MISLLNINTIQLKDYIEKLSNCEDENIFTNIDMIEIQDYFHIRSDDTFLVIKIAGEPDNMERELRYVKIPSKTFGNLLIVKGGKELTITSMMNMQKAIERGIDNECSNPMLTWFLDDRVSATEVLMIIKVFDAAENLTEAYFESLWDAIITDMNASVSVGTFDSLRTVKLWLDGDVVMLDTLGLTRSNYLLSLKKQDIEKYIFEYTGKKMTLDIK